MIATQMVCIEFIDRDFLYSLCTTPPSSFLTILSPIARSASIHPGNPGLQDDETPAMGESGPLDRTRGRCASNSLHLLRTSHSPGLPQAIPVRSVEPEADERIVFCRRYPVGLIALRRVKPKVDLDGTVFIPDFPYNLIYFNPATPLSLFSNRISHCSQQFKVGGFQ